MGTGPYFAGSVKRDNCGDRPPMNRRKRREKGPSRHKKEGKEKRRKRTAGNERQIFGEQRAPAAGGRGPRSPSQRRRRRRHQAEPHVLGEVEASQRDAEQPPGLLVPCRAVALVAGEGAALLSRGAMPDILENSRKLESARESPEKAEAGAVEEGGGKGKGGNVGCV